jgi:hypothetical protein
LSPGRSTPPALYDASRGTPIGTQPSPTPDDKRWVAAYTSTNGAGSNAGRDRVRRLLALAYILAVSVPPLGFGLGVVIAFRFSDVRRKHGVGIIVISIVASIIWTLIITAGALNTPTTGY